jgi:glycogen(starch) synthase
MTADPAASRRRCIAFLSYSTARFDSRTQRMAESALENGFDAIVYARWEPGLPIVSTGRGYTIVRVPAVPELAIPGMRGRGRRKLAALRRQAEAEAGPLAASSGAESTDEVDLAPTTLPEARPASAAAPPTVKAGRRLVDRLPSSLRGTIFGWPLRRARIASNAVGQWRRRLVMFPIRPIGWAIALEEVAEPADLWHGMWAASLPALDRLRHRHGGRTIYDSRDVYVHARGIATMHPVARSLLGRLERRWARRADTVITVNDAYARILADQFGIPTPPVVRNTPARYLRPTPAPDLLRERLGLPASIAVVLYQGGLMTERGIEQGMEAILAVPVASLVLMGFGSQQDALLRLARSPRYAERVRVVEPAPPTELLDWTASSDVMLMAIQPTTLNHRYTTPNKLWEAIAAGVPVVASDLPGMAAVVRETGCGVLVDPTDPNDIARGIRAILELSGKERGALLARCRAAGARYCWENESAVLLDLYRRLLDAA